MQQFIQIPIKNSYEPEKPLLDSLDSTTYPELMSHCAPVSEVK